MKERFKHFLFTASKEEVVEFIKSLQAVNNPGFNELINVLEG